MCPGCIVKTEYDEDAFKAYLPRARRKASRYNRSADYYAHSERLGRLIRDKYNNPCSPVLEPLELLLAQRTALDAVNSHLI